MGKIYDALKRAEKEAQEIRKKVQIPSNTGELLNNETPISQNSSIQATGHLSTSESITPAEPVKDSAKISDLKLISRVPISDSFIPAKSRFSFANFSKLLLKNTHAITPLYIPTIEAPQSIEAEQYKILKSRILSYCEQSKMRTLLVTSSIPGEGKSTVAANLSVSIANGINDYALLIDSDLRKPTIHKFFSLHNDSGLSNYLSENIPLSQALHKTAIKRLTVLQAGTSVNNPSELLSSKKMIELIGEITRRYEDRYIIFDSSPLLQTLEPAVLSKYVDGIIFVVKAGTTNRELVKRALDNLKKNKILGIVFNMVQDRNTNNYYSYYYSQP